MTPEQKRESAFEEFEELLLDGVPVAQAIEIAADDNELTPQVFETVAERILGDLQCYRERLLSNAEHERFHILLKGEVRKCRESVGAYASVGLLWGRAVELIVENLGQSLGRELTETEVEKVRKAWSNHLRLQTKALLAR